jgi:Chaperone of endosialidase/Head domain of trimeric autotransporter adhesin
MKTLLLFSLLTALPLAAQVPQALNYQGRVAVNGAAFTGTGQFRFALVNGAGAVLWSSHATNTTGLAVQNGLYSVRLGDTTLPNMAAVPSAVFANADVRLRVWFNDGTNGLQQLAPDQQLAPVGYAHRAATADSVPATAIAPNSLEPWMMAHSFQTGAATGLASVPAAGGVLNVTFPEPFDVRPQVTVGGLPVPGGNVTGTGFTLTIPPHDLVVDDGNPPANNIGTYNDALLVQGNPAIAYTDTTAGDLYYVRATNAQGSAWGVPVRVATGGSAVVGYYPSMALLAGNLPAISYYDSTNGDLKFVRALDVNGAAWAAPVTVVSTGTTGSHGVLVVKDIGGGDLRPFIAYLDSEDYLIKVVRGDGTGTTWGSPVTPVAGPSGFSYWVAPAFDMIVNGSALKLLYYHPTDGKLYDVQTTTSAGTTWGTPVQRRTGMDESASNVTLYAAGGGISATWQENTGALYTAWLPAAGELADVNVQVTSDSHAVIPGTFPAILFNTSAGMNVMHADNTAGTAWKTPRAFAAANASSYSYTGVRLADGSVLAVFHSQNGGGQLCVSGTAAPPTNAWQASTASPVLATAVVAGSISRDSLAPSFFGNAVLSPGTWATAFGNGTIAAGEQSLATGSQTRALGESSWAGGHETFATGNYSTAMGYRTRASGYAATALGSWSMAAGGNATAMGNFSNASGSESTAMGYYARASGSAATAMGSLTEASGRYATATGHGTEASGITSTAMGFVTIASGQYATAMGQDTAASGETSTALGALSIASGDYSTATGYDSIASGKISTALGRSSRAETYGEVSLGIFPRANTGDADDRVSTDVLLEVGNGTSSTGSNALTIFKDGRIGLGTRDTDAEVTHAFTLPNSATATEGHGRAQSWTTYSDSRIKTEQRPLAYGLSEIMRLQPRAYTQHSGCVENGTFKCADETGGSAQTIGFIAQEVEQVIPEAVQKPADPANQLYGMDYEKLIPVLVKATQELKSENDTLKAQLTAMQQRLEKLEHRPSRRK